jgi:hypothetical protein
MRLKKTQKEAVLKWVAAGLQSDEINELAAEFDPPFQISPRMVSYYRDTRGVDIGALIKAGEEEALTQGLALKGERVRKLKQLAALMEKDLFGGFLWLDQVKGIGSGDIAQIVDYEEFNKGEVDAYRGVLDDIAKELGHRVQRAELTGKDGGPIETKVTNDYSPAEHARAIAAFVQAIGSTGDPADDREDSAVGAAE